jgi:hypothetical protein
MDGCNENEKQQPLKDLVLVQVVVDNNQSDFHNKRGDDRLFLIPAWIVDNLIALETDSVQRVATSSAKVR